MKALLLAALFVFAPSVAMAKTYVCDVKSTTAFASGTFEPIANEDYWLGLIKVVTFDEDTGLLRYGSAGQWQQFKLEVVQRGTQSNDTLAIFSRKGLVSHTLNTLRIRAWLVGAPFIWDNEGDLFGGVCKSYG